LDLMETKLSMQDVRTLSVQKLIKFGVDCLHGLEVIRYTGNPRFIWRPSWILSDWFEFRTCKDTLVA
jgi:hypothetical protein